MKGNGTGKASTQRPDAVCVWCKQRFDNGAERELHVSKLGAPGEFHPACFEEYQQTPSP